ncbi:MAG: flagellar hook-basal body complex protein [Rhodospirillaceae bacterium]|nr:flagellar hook-basal body complex protein [Rhodospirillaceae bacterium]
MSLYSAMYAGVSGLFAQSARMGAISDNVANANTVGYKRSDVPFSTLVTTQALKHSYSAGGVLGNPRMEIDGQGQILGTENSTDLAISGQGFFVVSTLATADAGETAKTLFTRAGSFRPDSEGYLRNTAGYYLQGWPLDSAGEYVNGEPARTSFTGMETINTSGFNFVGEPTENITFAGNLPANETGQSTDGDTIVTGLEYFDPVGNPRSLNMGWTPTATYGTWILDITPADSSIPLSSFQVDFYTSGPNAGTPRAITEIPSTVAARDLETVTDNPDTPTGDTFTIDFHAGVTPSTIGDTLTISVGGTDYVYTTVSGDDDAANLASNVASFLSSSGITGVLSVAANSSGLVTVTGINDASGASLLDDGYPAVSGTGMPAANVTLRTTHGSTQVYPAGDSLELTFGSGAAAGDRIAMTFGSRVYTYVADGTETTAADLAAAIANYIDTNSISGVASVSVAGATVTVTGSTTGDGANLIDTFQAEGTDSTNAAKPAIEPAAGGTDEDNTPLLAGDVVQFDLQGLAVTLETGDTLNIEVDNTPIQIVLTAADIASDVALATRVKAALDAAGLPSVDSTAQSGAQVIITGTTDAGGAGAGLAGGAASFQALTVTRDTTANSVFVDDDGIPVAPSTAGDPIIARLSVPQLDGGIQEINLDLGALGQQDGITQFAGAYTPSTIERDGAQFGSLDRVEIGTDGVVTAIFDNGQVRPIYRLPLIDFVNPNGLTPVDGNAFQLSSEAGSYYMWDAGVGPAGEVSSSSLENSTVDIAEEFSNMIITQRAYSSNAKIIQTADEMLQELTNLKR